MGSSSSSNDDSNERKKRIVTVKPPAGSPKPVVKKQQKPFSPSRQLTDQEKRYAGFDMRNESTAARSERLAREKESADAIRAKYPTGSSERSDPAVKAGAAPGRSMTEREKSAGTRAAVSSLTESQFTAGARTAGMAQNRASIAELQSREREARNPVSKLNLQGQIKQLEAGARPVTTQKASGETLTVGVVSDGKFTGRPQFDPSSNAMVYDPLKGSYTRQKQDFNPKTGTFKTITPRQLGKATPKATSTATVAADSTETKAPAPTTTVKAPVSPVSAAPDGSIRRAMLSSGAGAAARRKFIQGYRSGIGN